MQELWPDSAPKIDVAARIASDERPAPPDRPWIALVMISSLDGAIQIDGLSGGLGAPSDKERFVAARQSADVIIVGATTARHENYRPSSSPIAVVSGSLSVDPSMELFSDPERPPLLCTTSQAAADRGSAFDGVAEVIDFGDSLEPAAVAGYLRRRGFAHAVLEGGPTLNGAFLGADLVDEILLSISPLTVGGPSPRILNTPAALDPPLRFSPDRVLMGDDLLFVRFLRQRQQST